MDMHFIIAGQSGAGSSSLALHLDRLNMLPGYSTGKELRYTAVSFGDVTEDKEPLAECDGLILVVNLLEGPMPGTREAIRRAFLGKVPVTGICLTHLDRFLEQTEISPAIRELVGWEARELLSLYGYTDDGIPLAEAALVTGCEPETAAFRDRVLAYIGA